MLVCLDFGLLGMLKLLFGEILFFVFILLLKLFIGWLLLSRVS